MVFEVFRSRQKEMLVALTLLAMFAFVFAGVLDRFTNRELSGDDTVIATAWGKDITARQVMRMQQDRMYANTFIAKARSWLALPDIGPQFDSSVNGAIEGIVILGKAERMGLSVNNEMVTQYINAITEDKLSKADFFSVLSGTSKTGKRDESPLSISELDLYQILGQEIMILYAVGTDSTRDFGHTLRSLGGS
ncbi:MAG: SurA N-terminal domain-containing protein [Planctomycetota bacterium]